jgi:uroporphyrinogen decarboxylase
MNSIERVLAAVTGKKTDRPPFTLTLSLYGAKLINANIQDYYTDPKLYVKGQLEVAYTIGPDVIFAPFCLTKQAAAFGSTLKWFINYPPNVSRPIATSYEEFLKLTKPNINDNVELLYLRKATAELASKFSTSAPVCVPLASPVDLPAIIMGIDAWIEMLVVNPDKARDVLLVCSEHFVEFANALADDGASFIACPMMFTNPTLLYEKLIDDLIIPCIDKAFAAVKVPVVFHHGGNRINESLHKYTCLSNVNAFLVDNRDSLSEARQILGEGVTLMGNLSGPLFDKYNKEKLLEKTKFILEDRADDRKFILASCSADVAYDTPLENLIALADLIKGYKYE